MRSLLGRLDLGRDVKLLVASMGIVSLAGGFSQVVQAIYLDMLGVTPIMIGVLASIATVGGALRNVLFAVLSDKFGRRNILFFVFLTSMLYNLIYYAATDYAFFVLAAIIGGAGGEGYGGYAEGALLSEKAGDSKRTLAFSVQYFASSSFSALGTLAAGLPDGITQAFGIPRLDAIRNIFALQACVVFLASALILLVSESKHKAERKEERYLSADSRKKIVKFSILGAFDGFGIGMIINLFSLWFYLRFGIGLATVGYIFTTSKVIETGAYLAGLPISKRIGVINTIRVARLGGAVSVGLMPFMPTYALAAVAYTSRNVIQHISIPLRSSYTMAIFNRNERASAASISNLTSTASNTMANALSGYIMENVDILLPPIISAGFVGIAAQLWYVFFKNIKPPEEQKKE